MADTHTIMSKKLAQALMDAGVQHFDGGGLMGGIGNFLGTNNNFQATGPTAQNQNFVPQIQTQQQRQTDVYGQQQNLANQLLQQSQGQGPNPALAQLNQQTGNNVSNQAALMAGQRGASANPGLVARQAAMQGANTQQQAVGQGATLQAQQQLAAQQALSGQQQNLAQNALSGESIEQGGLASQNNAALGVQQINANTAGQNAAANRGLIGGIFNGFGALSALSKGGEVPKMASGGVMGIENYGMAPAVPQWQDSTGGAWNTMMSSKGAKAGGEPTTTTGTAGPWETGGGLAGGAGDEMGAGSSGGAGLLALASEGGKIPFSQALLKGGSVPGQAQVKGNSEKNDTQPTLLSPGEVVLPRSVTQSPDMEKKAIAFLRHLKAGKKGGYGDVVAAKKACGGYA